MYEVQDEGPDIMFGWKSSEPVRGKKSVCTRGDVTPLNMNDFEFGALHRTSPYICVINSFEAQLKLQLLQEEDTLFTLQIFYYCVVPGRYLNKIFVYF